MGARAILLWGFEERNSSEADTYILFFKKNRVNNKFWENIYSTVLYLFVFFIASFLSLNRI